MSVYFYGLGPKHTRNNFESFDVYIHHLLQLSCYLRMSVAGIFGDQYYSYYYQVLNTISENHGALNKHYNRYPIKLYNSIYVLPGTYILSHTLLISRVYYPV